jgi:hypothetical protein
MIPCSLVCINISEEFIASIIMVEVVYFPKTIIRYNNNPKYENMDLI